MVVVSCSVEKRSIDLYTISSVDVVTGRGPVLYQVLRYISNGTWIDIGPHGDEEPWAG